MENKTHITSWCNIQNEKIVHDNQIIFGSESTDFAGFSKSAYKSLGVDYPKFFKMDALSKLAFLGAELLLPATSGSITENDTALLLANRSSSLDTDVKYQESIADKDNYFPSPAVFVYTLPNICLGEISIRHQLKSENSFFIFDAFNPEFMASYADVLIATGKAEKVLCGWTELFGNDYRAFLYLVGKTGQLGHNSQNISTLYNK